MTLTVRRVVTGHSQSAKSVFLEDRPIPGHTFTEDDKDALLTGLYRHDEFPASNQDVASSSDEKVTFIDLIASKPKELVSRSGTTFWAVDTAPHCKSVE